MRARFLLWPFGVAAAVLSTAAGPARAAAPVEKKLESAEETNRSRPPPTPEGTSQELAPLSPTSVEPPHDLAGEAPAPAPPPIHTRYLQYGLSLAGEFVLGSTPICDGDPRPPTCVLNSGGGIAVRVGVRTAGRWFIGGAYEFSKQDADKVYRLAILQQARAELRYYVDTGRDIEPMAIATAGVAGYGNEWALDTAGVVGSLGLGAEVQISRRAVAGFALAYRALYLGPFTDSGDTSRPGGITSMLGVDLFLEARDPLL